MIHRVYRFSNCNLRTYWLHVIVPGIECLLHIPGTGTEYLAPLALASVCSEYSTSIILLELYKVLVLQCTCTSSFDCRRTGTSTWYCNLWIVDIYSCHGTGYSSTVQYRAMLRCVKHSVNIPYNSTQTTYDASTPVHPYTICLHLFLYLELL